MSSIEILLLIGLVVLIVLTWRNQSVRSGDQAQFKERELQSQVDKLSGQGKEMYDRYKSLESEYKVTIKERDALAKILAQHEAKKEQYEKQCDRQLHDLTNAKQKFEQEQQRVTREDEAKRIQAETERDRIWAEHEQNVIAQLISLCKSPHLSFAHYTNTNLPDDFDGSLKPDFMIEFLDQYIIFDAKKSKQESLQTYINNSIKTTIQKVKRNKKIASMIYLVVPTEAIAELKTFIHSLDGYTIYVVSPESLPPILASLKKITTYEFADQMDPQQRENIVQYIAEMDFHINLQNATNIILTKRGTELLEKAQSIDPDIANEVALKKQPLNAKASLAAADLKKIVASLTEQNQEIQQLVSPKPTVKKKNLKVAQEVILESML